MQPMGDTPMTPGSRVFGRRTLSGSQSEKGSTNCENSADTVLSTLQRSIDEVGNADMAVWMDDDVDEDDGPMPWALGHHDAEPMEHWAEEEDDEADPWLDEQLNELRPNSSPHNEADLSADRCGH